MNSQVESKDETRDGRTAIAIQPTQRRKPWVTPIVSKSPVNELTATHFGGTGVDFTFYS